jgi:PTH1 family peptidyl-tRNA hydrolase
MGFLSLVKALFSRKKLPISASWLIIGLGNPGEKYRSTRHNVGYRVADEFGKQLKKPQKIHLCEADCLVSSIDPIIIAKPTTFMNRSGDAVLALMNKFNIPSTNVVVVVDDFNIACGTIRIRRDGSHGGHNGLKSISSQIGDNYPRVRIGIGPLPSGVNIIDFVLGQFTMDEEQKLENVIPRAADALKMFLTDSIDTVMNKYNK